MRLKVHPADLQDREAVPLVLEGMKEQFPRISHAWVDQAYSGSGKQWIEEHLGWTVEVVRHPPLPRGMWVFPGEEIDWTLFQRPKGFRGVLPRRWVVERTFAWLGRYRRLSKDYEHLPETSEAVIKIAAIHHYLRRLCPSKVSRSQRFRFKGHRPKQAA